MTKPIGSESNQLTSNDQLGRLAFLNNLPPDILKELQSLAWRFPATVQVEDSGTLAGSPALANKQYVQDIVNGATTIELIDGEAIILDAETFASRTLIFTGAIATQAQVTLPIAGQWFVINRCTGVGSLVLESEPQEPTVSLSAGENAAVYSDLSGVNLLSSPMTSFMTYYPFTATDGQTVFPFPYTPNLVLGFCAGKTFLPLQDFDASTGTQVVLNQGAVLGSEWTFVAITTAPIADAVPLSGGIMQGSLKLATGSTGTTPALGANDTSLATMAALYQDKRVIAGTQVIAQPSFALDPSLAGEVLSFSLETGTSVGLPDLRTLSAPLAWFDIVNVSVGGYVMLLGAQGFGQNDVYTGQPALAWTVGPGESVRIFADLTVGVWRVASLNKTQGRIIGVKSFLSAGTYQYTRTSGTRMILVHGAGAGGASGGLPACPVGYVAVAQAGSVGAKAFAMYTAGFDNAIITVGAGGQLVAANDAGQMGEDGATSSFGTLLTIPGGKGGGFAITNSASGVTAYVAAGSKAPLGKGIVTTNSGILAPAAFVNTAGMFGGIEANGNGLEGYSNGMGAVGQIAPSANASLSTATNPGNDGGFILYELT
jgi:hypothetical protein